MCIESDSNKYDPTCPDLALLTSNDVMKIVLILIFNLIFLLLKLLTSLFFNIEY